MKWVVDVSPKRRQYVETLYPAVRTSETWQVIAEDDKVEAVAVATPAASHFQLVKTMLEHGKHVFVEKPLATSLAEAQELATLAEREQRILFVGHTFLYNAAVRKIKEYIDSGDLGDIYYIFTQRLNLGRVRQDVNALWNLAPHDISIILYWLGESPQQVSARGHAFLQEDIEDVAFVNLDFLSGRTAHIHVSWLDPGKVRKIVIIGSKKMVIYDDTSQDAKIMLYDKGIDKKTMYDPLEPIRSFGHFQLLQRMGDVIVPYFTFSEPLQVQTSHFLESVLRDQRPLSDGNNGVQVVNVLEAAQRSMKANGELIGL
jgi:predicted dehydrogenase